MKYKINKTVLILIVTFMVAGLYAYMNCLDNDIEAQDLVRPNYAQSEKNIEIIAQSEDKENVAIDLKISPKKYSADEIQTVFNDVYERILSLMLNENTSLESVKKDLNLVDSLEDIPVQIEWFSSNYEVIDYDGHVNNLSFGVDQVENVELTLCLQYEIYMVQYPIMVKVVSADDNTQESFNKKLQYAIDKADTENTDKSSIVLPDSIDGIKIRYKKNSDWSGVIKLIILGFLTAVLITYYEKNKDKFADEKRKQELKIDYPEIVHKLTLLMESGMTIRVAWGKIAMDYMMNLKDNKIKKKCAYEEMVETFNQMKSGVSEVEAYNEFGLRCNTKEYLKFSSLITQNIVKGSRELIGLLQIEALDAFEERKNNARKCGETAGTKLLVPMIVMLLVVMVIIMFPAVMMFNI